MNSLTRLKLKNLILESMVKLYEQDEAEAVESETEAGESGDSSVGELTAIYAATAPTSSGFNSANFNPTEIFGQDGRLGPFLYAWFPSPTQERYADSWWTTGANARGTSSLESARWTNSAEKVEDSQGRTWYSLRGLDSPSEKLNNEYGDEPECSGNARSMFGALGLPYVDFEQYDAAKDEGLFETVEESDGTWTQVGPDGYAYRFMTLELCNYFLIRKPDHYRSVAMDAQAEREAEEAERARQPTLATRVDRAVRMMDIDVYGPILNVLDDAEQGNFGTRAQSMASDLLERTTTLSMLTPAWRNLGLGPEELGYEETGSMEPLAAAYRGVARTLLRTGLDGNQQALAYSLLAQSSGLESPVATRDELVRALTGVSLEEFERAIAQVRLMLRTASGEAEGVSANNPRRYVKREIKRLVSNDNPVFPAGYRDWSAEGAEELVYKMYGGVLG